MIAQGDILGSWVDVLSLLFFILILLACFYGQNWQGWYAGRQILRSLRHLEHWRDYGIRLIQKTITPLSSVSIAAHEIEKFIHEMLEFFVIAPSAIDPPVYQKVHFLNGQREARYHQLIREFLPAITDNALFTITSLLQATTEIDHTFKTVRHNLIIGKKTKSTWFLLQTAAEITQTMMNAQAYYRALDSFIEEVPIGDSIGPLAIQHFLKEIGYESHEHTSKIVEAPSADTQRIAMFKPLAKSIYFTSIEYEKRICYLLRAQGPASSVGSSGAAIVKLLEDLKEQEKKVSLIITIDAVLRLEGEKAGSVAQGLGVAVGGGNASNEIDKYEIESVAMGHNPPIPVESVVCRESLEEAVSPLTEKIENALPNIIRILKKIIRNQSIEGENVVIMGIGNALGVPILESHGKK